MECQNCSWSWDLESDDDNPYLCHKCGYDSVMENFDMESLQKWEEENNHPFDEYVEHSMMIQMIWNWCGTETEKIGLLRVLVKLIG